jgi:elongation factor Ts
MATTIAADDGNEKAVSAADVKKLRDLTSAGFMECKKALVATGGDIEKAVTFLRESGAAKAAKRGAEREATNGLVAAAPGVLIELNCETDFVAKNADFVALADRIAIVASETKPADSAALSAANLPSGKTVGEEIAELAIVIGEKLELGRTAGFGGETAVYLHRRAKDLPPQVGVLVAYDGEFEAARAAAMQVAALKAQYVTREDVPAETVETERSIAQALAIKEGKPEAALSKIVDGRLNGFFKDVVLLEQPSVQDGKKSVKAVLAEAKTTVTAFARFEIGA